VTSQPSSIAGLFELETQGRDSFTARAPARLAHAEVDAADTTSADQLRRVYGGQLLSQALSAAWRTVTDRDVHSLHAYFVAGANPDLPIAYRVQRTKDGRSVSVRQVLGEQGGRTLLVLLASFQAQQPGIEHHDPMPAVPAPEELPSSAGAEAFEWSGIDLRFAERWQTSGGSHGSRRLVWMRVQEQLPADRAAQACGLAYMSDLALIRTALARHQGAIAERGVTLASLDHSMWFHAPVRTADWLLYSAVSPEASGGRALALGTIYRRDGVPVATVAQEGLLRIGGAGTLRNR
jgi:acyl-CoA thioesterase-2